MNVVVTGGAGFLGQRLAARLLDLGTLTGPDGRPRAIERLTIVDAVPPAAAPSERRVHVVTGDIADAVVLERAIDENTDAVFHLAAVVSAMAEADFDLGMRVNVDGTRLLLERCRAAGRRPRLVFASSVAVYGGDLPDPVLDSTAVLPQSSYGAEKAIGELLVADYSRRGFVDGRVLRLPTVSVRPGRPNAAASSFASGIIREPMKGEPSVCPVDPATRLWLMSPRTAVECLIHGYNVATDALGLRRMVNLPGLSVTVREMVAALERVAGPSAVGHISWTRDPRVERIVETWPASWDDTRARALGFHADGSFDDVIRAHAADSGFARATPARRESPRSRPPRSRG
jgi:nucleoside-diphosphate-sugar epimerase